MLNPLSFKIGNPQRKLKKILGDYELPSFPGVITETLSRIRDPRSTAASISEALSTDPGLSVRVLSTVNSAANGLRRKIDSLDQAIALMGMANVESIVLSVAVRDSLPQQSLDGFDNNRFWRAAARRAVTAQALSARLHPALTSESFTASLLQDMAIPVLINGLTKTYGPLLTQWHDGDEDLAKLERAEFGWDHAEVGTWLCQKWDLPDRLMTAIGAHHTALTGGSDANACPPAVALVAHIRETEDRLGEEKLIEDARVRFDIPADEGAELIKTSFKQAEGLARLFVGP